MSDGWTNVSSLPGATADEMQIANNSGKLIVTFRVVQKKMEKKSLDAGRPIFEPVTFIRKLVPGNTGLVIDRPVRETDKEEFPMEWTRWEMHKDNRPIGIPIDHWPSITETQKEEFKALKIMTVEQFADLSDATGARIMGFQDLRRKAKAYVEAGKNDEVLAQVRAESDAKTAALQAQIEELKAMMQQQVPARKKPGRKPKIQHEEVSA